MNRSMRFGVFLAVTAVGVVAGHLVAWTMQLGPLGTLGVLALLFWTYRVLRKRMEPSDRPAPVSPLLPPEVLWSVVAFTALLGGGIAGMAAYNPDGYMQPRPPGPPWELIWFGTFVGAAAGSILAALLWLVVWLGSRRVRQASG